MKFGAFTYGYSTNLGDEVQTLAATQFLPRVDRLIERDRLHWYSAKQDTFVIFNGWFTRQPSWPPPPSIHPLFVAFYAAAPDVLISSRHADYFRKHAPIGCRSMATLEAFRRIGIEAYFSGCLTLTLERRETSRTDTVYAVDVDDHLYQRLVPENVRARAIHVSHEYPDAKASAAARAAWKTGDFLQRAFNRVDRSRRILRHLRELSNQRRHAIRIKRAEALLQRYREAKLVITSRLHCAMPCLALGTPVIVVRSDVHANPRFAGLRELVRCYGERDSRIALDWERPEPNSDAYLQYARELEKRCRDAVQKVSP